MKLTKVIHSCIHVFCIIFLKQFSCLSSQTSLFVIDSYFIQWTTKQLQKSQKHLLFVFTNFIYIAYMFVEYIFTFYVYLYFHKMDKLVAYVLLCSISLIKIKRGSGIGECCTTWTKVLQRTTNNPRPETLMVALRFTENARFTQATSEREAAMTRWHVLTGGVVRHVLLLSASDGKHRHKEERMVQMQPHPIQINKDPKLRTCLMWVHIRHFLREEYLSI